MIIIDLYKLLEKSLLETLLSVSKPLTSFQCKEQSRLFKAQITTSQQSTEILRSSTSCWCRTRFASISSAICLRATLRATLRVESYPIRRLTLRSALLYRDCKSIKE